MIGRARRDAILSITHLVGYHEAHKIGRVEILKLSRPAVIALLLVPVLALGLLVSARGQFAAAAPASSPIRLQQVRMVTASYGWATAGRRVLRTLDGGRTWHTVLSISVGISVGPQHQTGPLGFALSTLGRSSVWLAVPHTGRYCAVFRSFDAGSRWSLYF